MIEKCFLKYTRMTPDRFQHLLGLVRNKIVKQETKFRKPISAEERLTLTVRFLSSGESQQSLAFSYRIGRNTVSNIISETCDDIYQALKDDYLCCPATAEQWEHIAIQFEEKWNFPHVVGALAGKHVKAYFNSGAVE